MKVYIRKKNNSVWHWELECPEYPENNEVERQYKKPEKDELCTICIQIEAEGKKKVNFREIFDDDSLI
jgi:hypothetical protein